MQDTSSYCGHKQTDGAHPAGDAVCPAAEAPVLNHPRRRRRLHVRACAAEATAASSAVLQPWGATKHWGTARAQVRGLSAHVPAVRIPSAVGGEMSFIQDLLCSTSISVCAMYAL